MQKDTKEIRLIIYSIAIVYAWFGFLKLVGHSPVVELVQQTYPMLPQPASIYLLGIGEIGIALLILLPMTRKLGIIALWLQVASIFLGMVIHPSLYTAISNPLLLTYNGEFVIKNLVTLAASYSVWNYMSSKTM